MGACVNTVNCYGDWTLHVAVRGCVDGFVAKKTVKRLVATGSYVGVTNNQGLTPTNIAFNGGLGDIGEYLLFQGIEQHNPIIYSLPTAPTMEQFLSSNVIINRTNNELYHNARQYILFYREWSLRNDIFNNHLNAQYLQPSAPPQDSTLDEVVEEDVDCDVECDICMEEYEPDTQIFSCFRCRKSLCERCNRNIVMGTCPFCRADCSNVQYRNVKLESAIRRLYYKK